MYFRYLSLPLQLLISPPLRLIVTQTAACCVFRACLRVFVANAYQKWEFKTLLFEDKNIKER